MLGAKAKQKYDFRRRNDDVASSDNYGVDWKLRSMQQQEVSILSLLELANVSHSQLLVTPDQEAVKQPSFFLTNSSLLDCEHLFDAFSK